MIIKNLETALLLLVVLITASPPVESQEQITPSCPTTALDLDGDGYGWWEYQTCVVDDSTKAQPELINPETGEIVALVRPYWSGNRDIASRSIKCTWYLLDSITSQYIETYYPTDIVVHAPLPYKAPYVGDVTQGVSFQLDQAPAWTVSDGIYHGPLPIASADWIEQIGDPQQPGSSVRYWERQLHGSDKLASYFTCSDLSGAGFGPTGYPEESLPQDSSEPPELLLKAPAFRDAAEPVINLKTGAAVNLQTKVWDMHREIIGQSWFCRTYNWDENEQEYNTYRNDFDFSIYYFAPNVQPPHSTGNIFELFDHDRVAINGDWRQNGDIFESSFDSRPGDLGFHQRIEIIDAPAYNREHQGIETDSIFRSWRSSNEYYQCHHQGKIIGVSGHNYVTRRIAMDQSQDEQSDTATDESEYDNMGDSASDPAPEIHPTNNTAPTTSGGGTIGICFLIFLTFGLANIKGKLPQLTTSRICKQAVQFNFGGAVTRTIFTPSATRHYPQL